MKVSECCGAVLLEGSASYLYDRNGGAVEESGRCSRCKELTLLVDYTDDMPNDIEAYRNERAEEMP